MRKLILFFVALMVMGLVQMALSDSWNWSDDSDLSLGRPTVDVLSSELEPDMINRVGDYKGDGAEFQFLYHRNGDWVPVPGVPYDDQLSDEEGRIQATCKTRLNWNFQLGNSHFKLQGPQGEYKIKVSAACGGRYQLKFNENSQSGQAISLFETFERGRARLENSVGLDFWNRSIRVVWPSNGDYYQWGTVNISNGHHWDVVAHEMGHAIYDMGGLGRFGGGPHKIDECYSEALALSEGWASFFGAWLYVDKSDEDAKFQYLVPRRAPIRFEHVPEDVCRGTTNEWRVTSFLWDLIDLNYDDENAETLFSETWKALYKKRVQSISKARQVFEASGFSKSVVDEAWRKNF